MGALDLAGSFPAPQQPLLVIRSLQDGTTAAHAVMTADTVASGTDTDADRPEPPAKAWTAQAEMSRLSQAPTVMESRGGLVTAWVAEGEMHS